MKKNRLTAFLTKHWPAVTLFFFGIFLVFVRSAGSLDGDEAIYAQVARESLDRNSWLTLFWREVPWLEKPPLFLWLEMISIQWLGLSEIALRFWSGFFGVLTVVLVYFITFDFFKNRKGAFLAGFVLFSLPLFVDNMRSGMTDTMVTFFVVLALFSLFKGFFGNARWLLLFGFSTGVAIMTKSIVGVVPLVSLAALLFVERKNFREIRKELLWSGVILLIIVLPWHVFMALEFGATFWQDYLGFHVIDRFNENIIASPFENYAQAVLNRLGIWLIVFLALLFVAKDFVREHKSKMVFLFFNALFIIIVFSLADTVSPHYILSIFPLLAVLLGGLLGEVFSKNSRFAILVAAIALLNFLPVFVLQASNFGGSNILIPRAFDHFFHFSRAERGFISVLLVAVFLLLAFLLFEKHRKLVVTMALFVLISVNIFVPFHPKRSEQMKAVGAFIGEQENLATHIFMSESKRHLTNTLLFYSPLGVRVERIKSGTDPLLEKNKNQSICVILEEDPIFSGTEKALYVFQDGAVFWCADKF